MDLDITIFVQIALFLVLLVTLNGVIFKPFMRVIEERHRQVHEAKREVDRLERDASKDRDAYLARLAEARAKAQKAREQLVGQGRDEERKLLAETRAAISQALNKARDDVAQTEQSVRGELEGEVDVLARSMVQKVLGRELGT